MHAEHPHLIESIGFASAKARLKLMPACFYGHGRRAKHYVYNACLRFKHIVQTKIKVPFRRKARPSLKDSSRYSG